ncbi:MAG: restriction endonuclease subunit S [candidate division NC10 bacterium]|nr:restriction endonuclease subunit S [candidate division NC10 bacterium]
MEVKPGYKQTEVGVIPEEWEVAQIGDLKPFVTSGSRGWASYYSDRGSLFVRITNLSRDTIYLDLEDSKFVNLPPDASEGTRTQLHEYDVLISITADIGIVGYIDYRVPTPTYINQHIALVRFDPSKTSGKFVAYFLASEKPQKLFRASTDVGAKAGMSLLTVQKLQLALPPPPEQRAIAGVLSDVDALIGSLDRLIAKKRDLKQAAMQQLLTRQKRLPGFHGEWEMKRLGELARVQRGASPRPIDSPIWFDENSSIGWVRISDVTRSETFLRETIQRLSTLGVQHSRPVAKGSLIMSICATVGRPVITEIDACIHDGFVVFDNLKADKLFIYYVLKWIEPEWSKHGQTGSQMNLNTGLINGTRVSLPPRAEQAAIAEVLSDMDAELAALTQRRDKTRALKQGMMQELLTGRIRLV